MYGAMFYASKYHGGIKSSLLAFIAFLKSNGFLPHFEGFPFSKLDKHWQIIDKVEQSSFPQPPEYRDVK